MRYYATGIGYIDFEKILSNEDFSKVKETLEEEFEVCGYETTDRGGTTFDVGCYNKYHSDSVEECLDSLAAIAGIDSGEIRFVGEDDAVWRFVWRNGSWVEDSGYVIYYDPDRVESKKDHAFYSILGLLEDNLPDGDDEYAEECRRTYEEALAEYREAEKEIKTGK